MASKESSISIQPGYRPGFLARCLEMHITYYHPTILWGRVFETSLARDFGHLIDRLDSNPRNQVWAAIQSTPHADSNNFTQQIVGTILVDSESFQGSGTRTAQIRGFIVDERARGLGAGKKLLAAAMEFIKDNDFDRATLFTSRGQEASLHLYKKAGFDIEDEVDKVVWERRLKVLQLGWERPVLVTRVDDNRHKQEQDLLREESPI
ncbi:hypothetical protein F66182_10603 [Fusarium sp. NRRL 66182]|nr:hypothetical protein F66182_10603 [Fusarium sp. NRRL 66182]